MAQLLRFAFPGLERLLGELRDEVWKERVIICVQDFVLASNASTEPLVSRSPRLGQSVSTQSGAAKTLGIRIERLPALLAAAGVEVPERVTANGRVRRVISDKAVLAARDQLNDQVSLKSAARMLGLPTKRLIHLKRVGLIFDEAGPWSSRAVRDLESRIRERCREQQPEGAALSFAQALRRWVPVSRTADCFQAVFTGEFRLYQIHPSNLVSELRVEAASFAGWSAGSKVREAGHQTLPEAASQLGLKQQVVYHLASVGLLRTAACKVGSRTARLVSSDDLNQFKRSCIPLVLVAKRAGVAPKDAFEWAVAMQMKVVTGPQVDGGRQYFVECKDEKWRVDWP